MPRPRNTYPGVKFGAGLLCPKCGSVRIGVKDSRPAENTIRRRRHCLACKNRFTTYETTKEGLDFTGNFYAQLEEVRRIIDDMVIPTKISSVKLAEGLLRLENKPK